MITKKKQKYYSINSILNDKRYFDFVIGERGKGRKYEELKRTNKAKVRS